MQQSAQNESSPSDCAPLVIEIRKVCKRFPGVIALDHADFDLRAGEIHALLGENGAGKSTLMNILSGMYHPDEGEILVKGQRVTIRSPHEAISLRIGMVYQSFKLVSELTVLENIVLGDPTLPFWFNTGDIEDRVEDIIEKYGLQIDPRAKIWQLSVGEQQRVEIIKMFYRGADILILDEPTSVLTPQETRNLLEMMRAVVREGSSIIFISHKLNEVMEISDRITVLRKGKKINTVEAEGITQRELTRMMVGREVILQVKEDRRLPGRPVMEVENICALNDKQLPALRNVSFSLREGEILGLAGVSGNGQKELAEVLTGLRTASQGTIKIGDKELQGASVRRIIEAGVSFIPEKRLGRGLVPGFDIPGNLILKQYRSTEFSRGIFLRRKKIQAHGRALIKSFSIAAPETRNYVKLLSGGNVQKVILAREMTSNPKIIVASNPTAGLDISAIEFVQGVLERAKEDGTAILYISEELEELMRISDRIGVIYKGKIVSIMPVGETDIETIGLLMTGGEKGDED
jgi:general nucleoside transport system ATP-binding protein